MVLLACVTLASAALSPAQDSAAKAATTNELASQAWGVIAKHCYGCHGKDADPKNHRAKLNLKDHAKLVSSDRNIVVPKKVDASELVKRIESEDEKVRMPFKKPALSVAERKTLRDWVAAGAPAFESTAAATQSGSSDKPGETPVALRAAAPPKPEVSANRAASVKEIFRANCYKCHDAAKKKGGLDLTDRKAVLDRLVPKNSDQSRLFQLVAAKDDNRMPPEGNRPLTEEQIDTIRRWIAEGAPDLPAEAKPLDLQALNVKGELDDEYVLQQIRRFLHGPLKSDLTKISFARFFSLAHTLTGGTTEQALEWERDALALAINHLSEERELVKPQPIDDRKLVYYVDIRTLGWDKQPHVMMRQDQESEPNSTRTGLDLFDLALLEYPYSIIRTDSPALQALVAEFIEPAGLVRPIPYVRADWFASRATQSPLYEDFLQLPFHLKLLERRLGVRYDDNIRNGRVIRGGKVSSGVSRNNRIVERHPADNTDFYWASYDFRTSSGLENMFKNPVRLNKHRETTANTLDTRGEALNPAGGEFIWALKNGLQAYYVADGPGNRIEAAPTDIVVDKHASDKTVRNGLACMRCHEKGMQDVGDDVSPALGKLRNSNNFDLTFAKSLYPGEDALKVQVEKDRGIYYSALKKLFGTKLVESGGKSQEEVAKYHAVPSEPLINVSKQFLDEEVSLVKASAELGRQKPDGLESMFSTADLRAAGLFHLHAGRNIKRDTWEEYYDLVVRKLEQGVPVVAVDSLTRAEYQADPNVHVELTANRRFVAAGDKLEIRIKNTCNTPLYIELISTNPEGDKHIQVPSTTQVLPGKTHTCTLPVSESVGKDEFTVYASPIPFDAAEIYCYPQKSTKGNLRGGYYCRGRVVHKLYALERTNQNTYRVMHDPADMKMCKRTLTIETK
jgi:serine/threonine-protein kinase